MKNRLAASILAMLVLALAAFAGTSLAGNGNGNGNGNSNGNNGKSDQTPAATKTPPAPAPAPAAAPTKQAPSAPAKQAPAKAHPTHAAKPSKQSSTSPSNPATGGSNANGVKPSNTTKHDTYAKASSDQTKKYGNGKTAGQIATQAGYGDATLHGPGNSQPHKVLCGGHEVDVHALKAKGNKCGASTPAPPAATKPATESKQSTESTCAGTTQTVTEQVLVGVKHFTGPKGSGRYVVIHPSTKSAHYTGKHPDDVPVYETVTKTITSAANGACASTSTSTQTQTQTQTQTPAVAAVAAAQATSTTPQVQVTQTEAPATVVAAGGVKGATATLTPKKKARGGVLGATTRLGSAVTGRNLPFTGLPLWIFLAVALGLIVAGMAVRRSSADRI
jgi:hypothetical protein